MPGDKRKDGHVARAAKQKNANLLEAVLETDPKKQDPEVIKRAIIFGRVVKNLGPVFQVVVAVKNAGGVDRLVEVYGSGKGQMKQKKTKLQISVGSLVLVEGFHLPTVAGRIATVELVGVCLRKEVAHAAADGRISRLLWDDQDGDAGAGMVSADIFDRSEENEEGEEEEERGHAGGGGGARRPREVNMEEL